MDNDITERNDHQLNDGCAQEANTLDIRSNGEYP